MNVLEYFDLNARPKSDLDARIFFAYRRPLDGEKKPQPKPKLPWWDQAVMYAGLVIGVMFSSAILSKASAGPVITWGYVGWACGVALILMPTVYRKLRLSPDTPFLVRLGLFVQNGVFWDTLIQGIGKSIGKT